MKFTVYLTTIATTTVEVEAEDRSEAVDAVSYAEMPELCGFCSGGGPGSVDLGDAWEVAEVIEEKEQ